MTHDCNCHGSGDKLSRTAIGLLERPRYSPGIILQDSDLTAAVEYTRELNRLLFRSLFGCGVVCGLDIALGHDCGVQVTVSPGLALDGCGDPLQLTGPVRIELGRREGVLPKPGTENPPEQKDFWVLACSGEKTCDLREVVCDGDDFDGARQAARIRSTTEILVTFDPPHCVCGCSQFAEADDAKALAARAGDLLPERVADGNDRGYEDRPNPCGHDPHGCHEAHYTEPGCAADCGCGTACACGCCVLLGWVHWFDGVGWGVLHNGVRRFVRPCLIADPIEDTRPEARPSRDPGKPEEPKDPQKPAPRARQPS